MVGQYIVGLGGTFDHFHPGHERLLEVAFNIGKTVIVGLTTDQMHSGKKHDKLIHSYSVRKEGIEKYAERIHRIEDLHVIPLVDPLGPAITDPTLEVHVSSVETFPGALQINETRVKRGIPPLILVMIPMVVKHDGNRFSSTEIREGLSR